MDSIKTVAPDSIPKRPFKVGKRKFDFIKVKCCIGSSGTMENKVSSSPCLCSEIKWIWRISQGMFVNPLSMNFPKSEADRRTHKCTMTGKKLSWPFLLLSAIFLVYCVVWVIIQPVINPVIQALFSGPDAYAYKLHIYSRMIQTTSVVFCGLIFRRHFILAWDVMQDVSHYLKPVIPDLIRKTSKILSVLCVTFVIANELYTLFMGISMCYLDRDRATQKNGNGTGSILLANLKQECHEFNFKPSNYVSFVYTTGTVEFTHLALSSLLSVFAQIMRTLHESLALKLKEILQKKNNGQSFSILVSCNPVNDNAECKNEIGMTMTGEQELEEVRLLFEKLCKATIHLQKFFGLSCLIICLDDILTCVIGVYWRIIFWENITDKDGVSADINHVILFSLHFAFSKYSLVLILLSGQILSKSALHLVNVIREAKLHRLDSRQQFQVNMMMQTISGFPTRFSVYSITNLEMPFLAAAATNVVTYVLVLMQFRIDHRRFSQ